MSNLRYLLFMLIPIGNYFSLLRYLSAGKNNTCHLEHEPNFLAVNNEQLVTIQGRNLLDCRPLEDSLCFVPRFSGDAMGSSLCPKALFQAVTAEKLGELCAYRCHSGTHLKITQAGPERYFLTNPVGKLEVQCLVNKNQTLFLAAADRPGAVDIEVPCDCRFYMNDELKINELYLCDFLSKAKFQMIREIPAAWTKLKKLKIFPLTASSHTVFPSLEDCLDEDWPSVIPYLNLVVSRSFARPEELQLRDPVEVVSFLLKHLQSISLFVIGGTLLLIVVRNPYLVGIGTFPRVSAFSKNAMLTMEISITVFILGVIMCMILFLLWKWLSLKWKLWKTEEISPPVQTVVATTSETFNLREKFSENCRFKSKLVSESGEEFNVYLTLCD
ncbi:uncharacterized protein LOC134531226 [Bacillus rossius redtenbacheri]|uniref:uncharacterized protein LOC134531226 n=1 Tax=Bacillus rossius redtenbacheri TaxID=93214 RepID=UPI002FDE9458